MKVVEVRTKKERKDFFHFPLQLYKGDPYYVPQLLTDEYDEFDSQKNGAFDYCEAEMFVAYDDNGRVVGRIAAILNKAYNLKKSVNQVRFTRFDVIDDFEVTKALFEKVKEYAVAKGKVDRSHVVL